MELRRRLALLVAAALLTVPLAACGADISSELRGAGGTDEGVILTIDKLKYQVQVTRQLNPHDVEDANYLQGVPPAQRTLRPDETWFAVFLRVQNRTGQPRPAASMFALRDTQGNQYAPIPLLPGNDYAYYGRQVPPYSQIPLPNSPAQNFPGLDGALLLFKIRNFSYENRPLTLTIFSPGLPQTFERVQLDT